MTPILGLAEIGRGQRWDGWMAVGDQARMAWISGPVPMIAIIRFTL